MCLEDGGLIHGGSVELCNSQFSAFARAPPRRRMPTDELRRGRILDTICSSRVCSLGSRSWAGVGVGRQMELNISELA